MAGKAIVWILASIISGVFYRAGGTSLGTKWRDLGVPCVATAYLLALGIKAPIWAIVLHFGLLFGALTTYWDFLFGYDSFYMHGFMCGLSAFPLFWCGIAWWLILARAIMLAIFMGLWCEFWGFDEVEEGGRGFSIIATLPLLLI